MTEPRRISTSVALVGGGPVGLALAVTLGKAVLFGWSAVSMRQDGDGVRGRLRQSRRRAFPG
jgi:predicted NAD/FAD-dependent oxidoreductase